ncbi:hypothetical protein D3C75_910730 [compost metagenome]
MARSCPLMQQGVSHGFKRLCITVNLIGPDQVKSQIGNEQKLLIRTEDGGMRMRLLLSCMYSGILQTYRQSFLIHGHQTHEAAMIAAYYNKFIAGIS